MANDNANGQPANQNPSQSVADNEQLIASAFKDPNASRRERAGGPGILVDLFNMHNAWKTHESYINDGTAATRQAAKLIDRLEDGPRTAGVRITIFSEVNGSEIKYSGMAVTPGNSLQQAFSRDYLNPPGTRKSEYWIPADENLGMSQAAPRGERYQEVSLEQFGRLFGVKARNLRSEGEPDSPGTVVAGRQDLGSPAAAMQVAGVSTAHLKPGDDLRWTGDRTSLDYAFNIDQPRPSLGDRLAADLNALNSPQLNIGGRQVDNPYGEAMKKILEGVQSPEFTPQKNLDNAAALAAAWNGRFGEEIVAGHGKQGQLYLADGRGEAANVVSVNIRDTDGAAQKLLDAVVAKAVEPAQTQTSPALAIEPEQRRQGAPSLA